MNKGMNMLTMCPYCQKVLENEEMKQVENFFTGRRMIICPECHRDIQEEEQCNQ